jgi:hypothetical protein
MKHEHRVIITAQAHTFGTCSRAGAGAVRSKSGIPRAPR